MRVGANPPTNHKSIDRSGSLHHGGTTGHKDGRKGRIKWKSGRVKRRGGQTVQDRCYKGRSLLRHNGMTVLPMQKRVCWCQWFGRLPDTRIPKSIKYDNDTNWYEIKTQIFLYNFNLIFWK